MTRLIVWRHGNTDWNATGRVQGQTDTALNDLGRQQAAAAADLLVRLHPVAIVASDLRRAAETAAVLAERVDLPVKTDARLRERYFGTWQGLTMAEISERFPAEHGRWRAGADTIGCEIESLDDMGKRAADGLRSAAQLGDAGTVVVATHGAAARQAIGQLLGWPADLLRSVRALQNCHWAELLHDTARGWQLAAYNVGPFPDRPVPAPL